MHMVYECALIGLDYLVFGTHTSTNHIVNIKKAKIVWWKCL